MADGISLFLAQPNKRTLGIHRGRRGDKIDEVIVFGSRARGDYRSGRGFISGEISAIVSIGFFSDSFSPINMR